MKTTVYVTFTNGKTRKIGRFLTTGSLTEDYQKACIIAFRKFGRDSVQDVIIESPSTPHYEEEYV